MSNPGEIQRAASIDLGRRPGHSWEVIHDSVCQGLRFKDRQMRHTWDAEMGAPCWLRRAG